MCNATQDPPAKELPIPDTGSESLVIARGDRISLNEVSDSLSVSDRIAIGEHEMRKTVAYAVTGTFAVLNCSLFFLLVWLDSCDRELIAKDKLNAAQRLVSTDLLMTIVGATTVQLGAIAYIVATYLFPKTK